MDGPACQGCRERDARIAALEAQVAELRDLASELRETVRKQGKLIAGVASVGNRRARGSWSSRGRRRGTTHVMN